jgi:hypothetical protein
MAAAGMRGAKGHVCLRRARSLPQGTRAWRSL